MLAPDSGTISRFVHIYKGVEGFYFLNRAGELGYIKSADLRAVKETFPQLGDRPFLKANPDFVGELDTFLRDLVDVSDTYQKDAARLELGYILPAGQQNEWHTSTLVLHKHVVEALKADHEMMVQNGSKELVEGERDLARILGVRSIYQGLDELTYHRDASGRYPYFPALFVAPDSPMASPNIRVINLRWRDAGVNAARNGDARPRRSRELLFSVLRDNLVHRGAIDRSRRMENRLSIA